MVDSDQNEGESQEKMPPPEASADVAPSAHKRAREESSEDEQLPNKKPCTSLNETAPESHEAESSREVNGAVDSADEQKDKKPLETKEVQDGKPADVESTDENSDDKTGKKSEDPDIKEDNSNHKDATFKESQADSKAEDQREKDSMPKESAVTEGTREDDEEKSPSDQSKESKKRTVIKSQIQEAEVVEGLELSVECASDKEPSSSSESEQEKKPKRKTIIVKAKPNESELEVSTESEAEKSESQGASDVVTATKQNAKKGRRKRSRTSFSKPRSTGSEDSMDNVSDEDYSPRTKKKMKRAAAGKKPAKGSPETKRGRGRGRRPMQKPVEKETEENNDANVADDANDKKTEEEGSEGVSLGSKSENDSETENLTKDGKKRRRSTAKPEVDKRIQILKKYVRAAGIHVKSYNDLWAGCKSDVDKAECLKELLEKHGVTGRPSFEKCKKAKERNERVKDVSELDTSNILSEGRITRARKNMDKNPGKTAETPTKQREARSTFKRILTVVDSDSE